MTDNGGQKPFPGNLIPGIKKKQEEQRKFLEEWEKRLFTEPLEIKEMSGVSDLMVTNTSPLKHMVVGYVDFFDYDLKLQEVVARDWKQALINAFCIWEQKTPDCFPALDELPDDMEKAFDEAFNQDWTFRVLITSEGAVYETS